MLSQFFSAFSSSAMTGWFIFTLLVGLVWLKRHIDLNRARTEPTLTPRDAERTREYSTLSVLVAAKDEETNIGRCLEGLLRQDHPKLQVIAVNDRSTDRTAQIIDEIAARDSRCTAVHVHELPPGWFGKNNAMRVGMLQATGDLLCFTDADCTFDSPSLMRAAAAYLRDEEADLLSVLPELEAGTLWEKIVQPVAGGVMVYWFPPHKVNGPNPAVAYANGAFMMMPRAVYEKLGGHEFAKATLNEDMHMARRTKSLGLRLRVIRGAGMYRVRMYVGFRQIWRGWSRIFYGCFGTFPKLGASVLMLSLASLSPYITVALSPLAGADAGKMAFAGAFAILSQQSVLWRFYPVAGNAAILALTYPLGAMLVLGMTLNAMTRLLGLETKWRGTSYTGGARVGAASATRS